MIPLYYWAPFAAMLIAWDKARNTPQQIFGVAGVNSSPLVLVANKPDAKTIDDLGPNDKIAMPALVSPQMYALQMIAEHGSISNREHREAFNVSHKTAHLELTMLEDKKLVKSEGAGRSTRYILAQQRIEE